VSSGPIPFAARDGSGDLPEAGGMLRQAATLGLPAIPAGWLSEHCQTQPWAVVMTARHVGAVAAWRSTVGDCKRYRHRSPTLRGRPGPIRCDVAVGRRVTDCPQHPRLTGCLTGPPRRWSPPSGTSAEAPHSGSRTIRWGRDARHTAPGPGHGSPTPARIGDRLGQLPHLAVLRRRAHKLSAHVRSHGQTANRIERRARSYRN
jgi:hypothetical protein